MEKNRIIIFKEKERKENGPTMTGKLEIDGNNYRVALWPHTSSETGEVFMAGEVTVREDRTDEFMEE